MGKFIIAVLMLVTSFGAFSQQENGKIETLKSYRSYLAKGYESDYLIKELINKNTSLSNRTLGYIYIEGLGVESHPHKAIIFYKKAYEIDGNGVAAFNIAQIYSEKLNDPIKSEQYYKLSANAGNCDAMNTLGVDKNSIEWLIKADKCGSLDGTFNLGMLKLDDNSDEGIALLNKASSKGYNKASFNLAAYYYQGKYVDKDVAKSKKLFLLAAEQGHQKAFSYYNRIKLKVAKMQTVKGAFEVDLAPSKDDVDMGRMVLDKTYSGALSGTAKGQMLSHRTQVQGSAAYVALEHFEGELEGKKGTFSLVHTGFMDKGASSLEIKIVPDSGTGELEGIKGTMDIQIEDGKHFYNLEYQL